MLRSCFTILLIIALFIAGCKGNSNLADGDTHGEPQNGIVDKNEQRREIVEERTAIKVILYLPVPNKHMLEKKDKLIVINEDEREVIFKSVLNNIFENEILGVQVKDNATAVVNLSSNFIVEEPLAQVLKVYAVVNTLGQFPGIERVNFTVQGDDPQKQPGWYILLSDNFYPDETFCTENWQQKSVVQLNASNSGKITTLMGLPDYFTLQGWIDKDRLFGLAGEKPVIYNLKTGTYRSLDIRAINALLSPNSKLLAYQNENDISIVSIDGSINKEITTLKDIIKTSALVSVNPMLCSWSPDGKKLLFSLQYEWDADYYVFNIENKKTKKVNTHLKDYFLTSFAGWFDNEKIIFNTRANRMLNGKQEYNFGYRSDIAVANLTNNDFYLLTSAEDGVFYEAISILPSKIYFRRYLKEKDEYYFGFINPQTLSVKYLDGIAPDFSNLYPSPQNNYFILSKTPTNLFMNSMASIYLKVGENEPEPFLHLRYNDRKPHFIWSPGGTKIAFTISIAVPRDYLNKSYITRYQTYLFQFDGMP